MKKLLLTAAASVLSIATASAADLPVARQAPVPPPVAVTTSWTGCYLGAGGGYGMWNQETYAETFPALVALTSPTTAGGRGWFGTVQVGCDYQIGSSWLIGAFGDYDFGSIKGTYSPAATTGGVNFSSPEKMSSAWAVGGRIGWLPFDRLLTFVSGGYTQARFDQMNFFSVVAPFGSVDLSIAAHTYTGWFIGSGYEYAIGFLPSLYWKTEYRYSSYRADNLPFFFTSTGAVGTAGINSQKYVQTVRSELVWRFNWGGSVVARY
jgi:outer membrane immunogenic protein